MKTYCIFKRTPENVVFEHNEDITKKKKLDKFVIELKVTAEDMWLEAIFLRANLKEFSIYFEDFTNAFNPGNQGVLKTLNI